MLESFKSISFGRKFLRPWKIAVGCLLSMMLLVHAYAAGGVGGRTPAMTGGVPQEANGGKAVNERAKPDQTSSSPKFGGAAKGAAEQAKTGQMTSSPKFGGATKESGAERNKMQSKMGGGQMDSAKTGLQAKQMQMQMQGQKQMP